MSILCSFFVSDHNEALIFEQTASCGRTAALQRFPHAEFTGITNLEPTTLWAILAGVEWDIDKHWLNELKISSDSETWLYQFPKDFVNLLARLDAQTIDAVAQPWAETEELDCSPNYVRPIVEALAKLAKEATKTGKDLFLFGSL